MKNRIFAFKLRSLLEIRTVILVSILLSWSLCNGQTPAMVDSIKVEKPGKKYQPKISGFIQVQSLQHFDSNGDGEVLPWRFRVQRARLKVDGYIAKKYPIN